MDSYHVLITGSNRGIGHALCAKYLARPNHTVIACIRNPSRPTSHLTSLFRGENTNLIISHIDSTDASTPSAAIARLQAQGITHLDLVIANAGICTCFPTAAEARLDDVRAHHEVNVLGPLAVFQATLPMLNHALRPGNLRGRERGDGDGDKKRTKKKKGIFVAISSIGASISGMNRVMAPSSAYGPSKVALNYIMRKAHFENHERVCVFMVEPGWVKTEMGIRAAKLLGHEDAAETEVEEAVTGIVGVIDKAQQEPEAYAGRFLSYSGNNDDYPW